MHKVELSGRGWHWLLEQSNSFFNSIFLSWWQHPETCRRRLDSKPSSLMDHLDKNYSPRLLLSALSVSVSLTVCLDITADCHQRLSCVFCPVFLCSRFVSHFLSPLTPSRSLVAPLWAWFLPKVSPVKSDQLLYFSFTNHFVLLKENHRTYCFFVWLILCFLEAHIHICIYE